MDGGGEDRRSRPSGVRRGRGRVVALVAGQSAVHLDRRAPSRSDRNLRRPRSEQRAPRSRLDARARSPPWAAPFSSPAMRAPAAEREPWALAALLAALALADVLHDGPHPPPAAGGTSSRSWSRRVRCSRHVGLESDVRSRRRSASPRLILVASFLRERARPGSISGSSARAAIRSPSTRSSRRRASSSSAGRSSLSRCGTRRSVGAAP